MLCMPIFNELSFMDPDILDNFQLFLTDPRNTIYNNLQAQLINNISNRVSLTYYR